MSDQNKTAQMALVIDDQEVYDGEIMPNNPTANLAYIKKHLAAFQEMRIQALQLVQPSGIVNIGGNPYILAEAALLVATQFHVSIIIKDQKMSTEVIQHKDGDEETLYTVTGNVHVFGSVFTEVGCASTKDHLYKSNPDLTGSYLRKKSVTNMIGRAARKALGLGSFTWEEITKHTGITQEQVKSAYFKGQGKEKQPLDENTANMLDAIKDMGEFLSNGDKALEETMLMDATRFKGTDGKIIEGKRDYNKLSAKQIPFVYKKYKEKFEKVQGEIK